MEVRQNPKPHFLLHCSAQCQDLPKQESCQMFSRAFPPDPLLFFLQHCISYLLLCNKITPNSAVKDNIDLLPHCFWGSGIWEWLGWVVLVHVLLGGGHQDVGWGCSHLQAWLGLRESLPVSLTCVDRPYFILGRWTEGFSSLLARGPSQLLAMWAFLKGSS